MGMLKQTDLFPVADRPSYDERKRLGISLDDVRNLRARWTGEHRTPRRGEWFLSGAIVEAYHAPNDLTTKYHIAEIVLTRTETKVTTVVVKPQ